MYNVSIAVISDGESVGPQELHGAGWYGPRDHQASHNHQTILCDLYQVWGRINTVGWVQWEEGRREEGGGRRGKEGEGGGRRGRGGSNGRRGRN